MVRRSNIHTRRCLQQSAQHNPHVACEWGHRVRTGIVAREIADLNPLEIFTFGDTRKKLKGTRRLTWKFQAAVAIMDADVCELAFR